MTVPMDTTASTSFDHQLTRNESPASIILCTTTTQQQNDGPMDNNFQAAPKVSSSNIPFGVQTLFTADNSAMNGSYESVIPGANIGAVYNQLPFDAVQFGLFVAQRLTKLPDERSRRKLEHSIQAVILDIEREYFQ